MQFSQQDGHPKKTNTKSRMSMRKINEMNRKNRKTRDSKSLSSSVYSRPLFQTQQLSRPRPNFCLQVTKRSNSQYSARSIELVSHPSMLVNGFRPTLKPKLLHDNPFILGNIIRKKLKIMASGDIDSYLQLLATNSMKKTENKNHFLPYFPFN